MGANGYLPNLRWSSWGGKVARPRARDIPVQDLRAQLRDRPRGQLSDAGPLVAPEALCWAIPLHDPPLSGRGSAHPAERRSQSEGDFRLGLPHVAKWRGRHLWDRRVGPGVYQSSTNLFGIGPHRRARRKYQQATSPTELDLSEHDATGIATQSGSVAP